MSNRYLSHAERLALGAGQRKQLPRSGHAAWFPHQRKHDPLSLLADSMQGRLPKLVALKYQLMAMSPFGFFRGAVPVMAADLALLPHSGILNQICGDAHVRNLGAYEAPDGRLVFDINDFDETLHAPFEWDLKRLAASLVLAGRESGSKESVCREAVGEFAGAYAGLMGCLSELPVLEMTRFQVHRLGQEGLVSRVLLKAERSTPARSLATLTVPAASGTVAAADQRRGKAGKQTAAAGAEPREALPAAGKATPAERVFKMIPSGIEGAPPALERVSPQGAQQVLAALGAYRKTLLPERRHFLDQYRAIDVGFKVVGTGSVGLRDYVVYLEGNGPGDPLFLQVKEEARSGWAPYVEQVNDLAHRPAHQPAHEGQRVAEGQRAMQFQSDPFLGWTTIADDRGHDRPYLVRQLNDHKASIEVDDLHGAGLAEYAQTCGELLARGHARSGDPAVLTGYIGKGNSLGDALAAFAVLYADQTERDWKTLVRSGLGSKAASPRPTPAPKAAAPGEKAAAKKPTRGRTGRPQ